MTLAKQGTAILGPEGQGYIVKQDIHHGDLARAEGFEPFGGAPSPTDGDVVPEWLGRVIRGDCHRHQNDY